MPDILATQEHTIDFGTVKKLIDALDSYVDAYDGLTTRRDTSVGRNNTPDEKARNRENGILNAHLQHMAAISRAITAEIDRISWERRDFSMLHPEPHPLTALRQSAPQCR